MKNQNETLYKIINLLSELTVFSTVKFNDFLSNLIKLIDEIIPTDSCLVYFYDIEEDELTLIGSKKPKKNLIGKISLKKGEGITGWVAYHQKTVVINEKAYEDKRFKRFTELPEDKFEAFLSVPIINKDGIIGVLNLQDKKPRIFNKNEIKLVELVVKIIASAFENIVLERKIKYLNEKISERKVVERAKGLLMKVRNISEDKAYMLIRSEAMNKRKSLKDVAEAIIMVFGMT